MLFSASSLMESEGKEWTCPICIAAPITSQQSLILKPDKMTDGQKLDVEEKKTRTMTSSGLIGNQSNRETMTKFHCRLLR